MTGQGSCADCGYKLQLYDASHPAWDAVGALDVWSCSGCGKDVGATLGQDQLFSCRNMEDCGPGLCRACCPQAPQKLAGLLSKWSHAHGKAWQERWFVLDPEELTMTYYKGKNGASLFSEMDADSSGYLDQGEVAELSAAMGKKLSGKELQRAMLSMDSNNDNQISADEFMRWWDINGGKYKKNREVSGSIQLRTVEDIEVVDSVMEFEVVGTLEGEQYRYKFKANSFTEGASWIAGLQHLSPGVAGPVSMMAPPVVGDEVQLIEDKAVEVKMGNTEIAFILAKVPAMAKIGEKARKAVAKAMKVVEFSSGQAIITQGDVGNTFYIIESGKAVVSIKIGDAPPKGTIILKEGMHFGEMALLNDEPRNATVRAHGVCRCLELDRKAFKKHMEESVGSLEAPAPAPARTDLSQPASTTAPLVALTSIAPTKKEEIASILAKVPAMAKIGDKGRKAVAKAMKVVEFTAGQKIMAQGDVGNTFYIIESGKAVVSIKTGDGPAKGSIILKEGMHFGEMALLNDEPRNATVRAHGACRCLELNRKVFKKHVAEAVGGMEQDGEVMEAEEDEAADDSAPLVSTTSKVAELDSKKIKTAGLLRRNATDITDILAKVPAMAEIDEKSRKAVAKAMKVVEFSSGQKIIAQGDIGKTFYIIESGKAVVSIKTGDGPAKGSIILKEGMHFGEMALLNDEPRNATVRAHGACRCLELSRRAFQKHVGDRVSRIEQEGEHVEATTHGGRIEGFLKKSSPKSGFGKTMWQERWFVLDEEAGTLSYYKAKDARTMFYEADADGSGFLDKDEMAELCKALGRKMGEKDILGAMAAMDQDGNGEVNLEEFEYWWRLHGGKHSKDTTEPAGSIAIAAIAVIASVGGKEISISDGERTFNLAAETDADADRWLENLRRVAPTAANTEHRPGDKKLSKKGKDEVMKETLAVAAAAALRVADKVEEERIAAKLEEAAIIKKKLWGELDEVLGACLQLILETTDETGWLADPDDMSYLLERSAN